jgi:prepilin-type N-terminal cleavage/methylation domain-containing protein
MLRNRKGFTLIEMIIVMVVFIVVIAISGEVFRIVLQQSSKIFRSEESNIEGIVGLEILRHDLQQAGYGLYTETLSTAYTDEATVAPASTYNETGKTRPPRALVAGNNLTGRSDTTSVSGSTFNILDGSDYLVLKGLTLGRNAASQKWTYLENGLAGVAPKIWGSGAENLNSSDYVMLMRRTITQTGKTLAIVPDASNNFYRKYDSSTMTAFKQYSSSTNEYVIYGLDDSLPQMPFNRSDYFVARPSTSTSIPSLCAPNIGTLYKTVLSQSTGKLSYLPLLDCVADMQVVLGWDLTIGNTAAAGQDGMIDTWSSPDPASCAGSGCSMSPGGVSDAMADPVLLAAALKVVKVYILAQVGRKDPGYISPSPITVGDANEQSITRNYSLASDKLNYHWKVYRIVVRPKNLVSNQ